MWWILLALILTSCGQQAVESTESPLQESLVKETPMLENQSIASFLSRDPPYSVIYTVQSNRENSEEIVHITKEGVRLRKDIISAKGEARMLKDEDGVTACYLISGHWACSKGTMPELELEQKRALLSDSFSQTKSRNLLGSLATCFSGSNKGTMMEYCFSEQGIILYAKITQGGYTSIYSATSSTQNNSRTAWQVP